MIFCFFSHFFFSTARTVILNVMSFTWLNKKIIKLVLSRFLIYLMLLLCHLFYIAKSASR